LELYLLLLPALALPERKFVENLEGASRLGAERAPSRLHLSPFSIFFQFSPFLVFLRNETVDGKESF
jgi:hypothetical protein